VPETPDDAPTEVIPAAETGDGLAGTRELPAVGAEPPTEVVAPVTEAPAEAVAEPPTEAMAPPTAAVTEAPAPPAEPPAEAGPEPPAEAEAASSADEPPAAAAEPPAEDVADPPTEAMAPPTGAVPEPPADEPLADEPPADEPRADESPVEAAESPTEEPAPELPELPEVAAAVAAGVSPDVARSLAQAEPPRDPVPRRRPPEPHPDTHPDADPDPEPAPLDLLPSREDAPPERGSTLAAVRGGWGPRATVLAVLLLLVVLVVVIRPDGGGDETAERPTPTPAAAAVTIPAELSSVDPSGGTGLRQEGDRWRTQSYNSAEFGNLKDGVGLLLDLGAPRAVASVTLDVEGPLAIELRAGDEPGAAGDSFAQVSAAPNASGTTSLDGSKGGEHRYWLVWVTRLASGDGGYRAVLGTPVVRGPAT
jgi:hypothetical protein